MVYNSIFGNAEDILNRCIGKIFTEIRNEIDEIIFTGNGIKLTMYHSQGCCEVVRVEEIVGDLEDIIGSEIIEFEKVSSGDYNPDGYNYDYSYLWTFYKVGTKKGFVTIRWLGESNGYYSEEVDLKLEVD